jgi:hypothetical protein
MAFAFLRLTALRLAPDWIATLKPGGIHLMLMKPPATLKAGSKGGRVQTGWWRALSNQQKSSDCACHARSTSVF